MPGQAYNSFMEKNSIEIVVVQNQADFDEAMKVRRAVFVDEQKIPAEQEFDGNDFVSTHILAKVTATILFLPIFWRKSTVSASVRCVSAIFPILQNLSEWPFCRNTVRAAFPTTL